ncbi:MAG: hypothetical protein COA78_32760 [Blastopirellula sp.]|nr:MAG: hypothetical protein COA78_32760 [Blastopirellula sp.]
MVLITSLIILNIPVYLFIGWVVFDTTEGMLVTLLTFLRFRWLGKGSRRKDVPELFMVYSFIAACIATVAGEYYLIDKYILSTG